jgi:ketol-acid reductoisomerase
MMRLTIIGFGNQARAWSMNLKDSNYRVRVAVKPGSPSLSSAKALGLETVEIGTSAFFEDTAFALLTPDHTHAEFLKEHGKKFKSGSVMLYAHGFSCVENGFQDQYPQIQHVLFAPKAIGSELRRQYTLNGKLGAVYSLDYANEKNLVKEWLLELARALGINMGPYPTTFLRETQADLYSEQGLLCSLIPYTAGEMFRHLVESGVEKELAYFECWHELKLIVSAMVDAGPEAFFDLISPNALIGSEKGYQKLITEDFKKNLHSLLIDIQHGKFNQELAATNVNDVRSKIKDRWKNSPLNKTFHDINRYLE